MTAVVGERDKELRAEAIVIGRYLVGVVPEPELIARYAAANRALFPDPPAAGDQVLLDHCRRRPWTLPLLDAAAGLLGSQSLLRKKIVVMAAVLETTPRHVEDFRPEVVSAPAFLIRVSWLGIRAAGKAVAGVVLWMALRGVRA